MEDESRTQRLLSNSAEKSNQLRSAEAEDAQQRMSTEKPLRLNCSNMDGKDWQCGGAACPWMRNDAEERSEDMKKLSKAVIFCVLFMLVEVAGGIQAGSLAILTDAAHLLSDVASFAISLFAMWAGGWEANLRQTYGFFRLEILGALVSIQIIWLITGIIVYEAFVRLFKNPVSIDGRLMFIIASLGLVVNLVMMFLLDHGHDHGHAHGHAHGSSHGHSHGHSHGRSHGHGDGHKEHEHSPVVIHRRHGDEHSHDGGHQHKGEPANLDREVLSLSPSDRIDENTALILEQDGHKTECVRKNFAKSPRSTSGDTIIMCICDQVESQTEGERSVKVTIDHGGDNDVGRGSKSGTSINVRGAYLHVLGDLIQSVGVMIGGAIIWCKPEWKIVDLICTFIFSFLVLWTTIKMIRDILEVLMESTPREVDAGALQQGLMEIDGVIAVHELHIWAITVGKVVLACHVMIEPHADSDDLLAEVVQYCDKKYKISHVTVQIERYKP